jgi:hypothetical protein
MRLRGRNVTTSGSPRRHSFASTNCGAPGYLHPTRRSLAARLHSPPSSQVESSKKHSLPPSPRGLPLPLQTSNNFSVAPPARKRQPILDSAATVVRPQTRNGSLQRFASKQKSPPLHPPLLLSVRLKDLQERESTPPGAHQSRPRTHIIPRREDLYLFEKLLHHKLLQHREQLTRQVEDPDDVLRRDLDDIQRAVAVLERDEVSIVPT